MNKPVGLSVHADSAGRIDTLVGRLLKYLYENGSYNPSAENSFTPALCNRIDRNTSGIVIGAKTAAALRIINEKIKNQEIVKQYIFICHGIPKDSSGMLKHYLKKDGESNIVTVVPSGDKDAKIAVTEYKVLESKNRYSLVEATLITGRTHQIRAQFAEIGHPLLGDGKYGKIFYRKDVKLRHQALASYSVTFDFKTDTDVLSYLCGKTVTLENVWLENVWRQL